MLFMIFFSATVSHAEIVRNRCIVKISEVLKDLPEVADKEHTVAIFDWDSTLAKWFGHQFGAFEPRETGENGTLFMIDALHNAGINKMMVLTARLGGYRGDDESRSGLLIKEDAEIHAGNMLQMLGKERWQQNGAFANPNFDELNMGRIDPKKDRDH